MAQVWCVAVACLLGLVVVTGQENAEREGCVWDSTIEIGQGLKPQSWDNGAKYSAYLPDISDAQGCQEACCLKEEECQLALIGTPADGKTECYLVHCMNNGTDVCVLRPDPQFKVFKKQVSASPEPKAATAIVGTASPAPIAADDDAVDVRSANSTDHCRLPRVVGPCRAAFPRFYYDPTNQTCKLFIYGGCGANRNNFETADECGTACSGVTGATLPGEPRASPSQSRMVSREDNKAASLDSPLPEMTSDVFAERCQPAPETGPCRASMRYYYYDTASATCKTFTYGGCLGNKNNYATAEMCLATCTVRIVPRSKKMTGDQDACTMPSDSGPCRAAFQMFYFDSGTKSCQPFTYGGCRGNGNRYSSVEDCMTKCAGQEGRFDEHGNQPRDRWTPAFFLVATLAIISALLLVGFILISVRRNRFQRLRTVDDKEELLPEEQAPKEKPSEADTA